MAIRISTKEKSLALLESVCGCGCGSRDVFTWHRHRSSNVEPALLTPSIDHLFDHGFIGFESDGNLIILPVAYCFNEWGSKPQISLMFEELRAAKDRFLSSIGMLNCFNPFALITRRRFRFSISLPPCHLLCGEKHQIAFVLFDLAEQSAELCKYACVLPLTAPYNVVGLAFPKIR